MIIMVFDPFGTPYFFPSADFIRIYPQLDSAFRPVFFFFFNPETCRLLRLLFRRSQI